MAPWGASNRLVEIVEALRYLGEIIFSLVQLYGGEAIVQARRHLDAEREAIIMGLLCDAKAPPWQRKERHEDKDDTGDD